MKPDEPSTDGRPRPSGFAKGGATWQAIRAGSVADPLHGTFLAACLAGRSRSGLTSRQTGPGPAISLGDRHPDMSDILGQHPQPVAHVDSPGGIRRNFHEHSAIVGIGP